MLRSGEISPRRSHGVCGTVFLAEGPANTEAPEGSMAGAEWWNGVSQKGAGESLKTTK